MTLTTAIGGCIIILLFMMTILMTWYIRQAVKQIRVSEQYTYEIIEGIEELKIAMESYVNHVGVVNEMEMFYGDETLRELIRHGKDLVETFEDYKINYFPILEMEEELNDYYKEYENITDTNTQE